MHGSYHSWPQLLRLIERAAVVAKKDSIRSGYGQAGNDWNL